MTTFGSRTDPRSPMRAGKVPRPLARVLASAALASLALTVPCTADGKPQPKRPAQGPSGTGQCAQVRASVRMEAYGYTHVVSLRNDCDRPVSCEVWTDVDPTPHQPLRAAPGETQELITRRGSPAREVSAGSSCRFD